jgi:hypothetical protein
MEDVPAGAVPDYPVKRHKFRYLNWRWVPCCVLCLPKYIVIQTALVLVICCFILSFVVLKKQKRAQSHPLHS